MDEIIQGISGNNVYIIVDTKPDLLVLLRNRPNNSKTLDGCGVDGLLDDDILGLLGLGNDQDAHMIVGMVLGSKTD